MPPRSSATVEICSGTISFFVKLYPVASEKEAPLTRVHRRCGGKLAQQTFCAADQVTVERSETARQYELDDGRVASLTDEEVKAAESQRVGTLDVVEYVPDVGIDPVCVAKTTFVGPGDEHEEPYAALVRALLETRTLAVGIYYRPTRDQLALLCPYGERGLLMREVFYASELRPLDEITLPHVDQGAMAAAGVEAWRNKIAEHRAVAFNAATYADGYPDRLRTAAERKAGGVPTLAAARRTHLLDEARVEIATGRPRKVRGNK